MTKPPDKKIIPFRRPELPLTAEEQWLDRLIKDFGSLSVEGQLEALFAACDIDALALIASRIAEAVEHFNGDAPDPEAA
jgi:hypothetical protein